MDPYTHIWLVEQDRERAMTRKALERAARSGGAQTPGLARGDITGFARVLRRAASAAFQVRPGRPAQTTHLTGASGV